MTDYDLPAELRITIDGPVRVVTLNRPAELNACNAAMHRGLTHVWRQIAADREARAVVVTGEGDAFSAGGDFRWLTELNQDAAQAAAAAEEAGELAQEMLRIPLPVVAAVNGPAVGLGCSLTVLSDLVVMSEDAHLADPHVSVGLVAGDGGAYWPLLTSMHRAKEFLFLGSKLSASEALSLGLANRVVAPERVLTESLSLAHRLASQPPLALQDTKRALNTVMTSTAGAGASLAVLAERVSMTSAAHGDRLTQLLGAAKG